mgnify:CR=1 FL=1
MPAGTAVADVEAKLKKQFGSNKGAIFGTLNKIGLMHGNKATAKGLRKARKGKLSKMTESPAVMRHVMGT